MNEEKPQYWFPAKRYGWGWGPPTTWQGWMVLLVWLTFLVAISPWLVLQSPPLFALFLVVMSVALMGICFAKGEPPKWRWGGRE